MRPGDVRGYASILNNGVNPWVGDQRGTVCCPEIKSPAGITFTTANCVTTFINPLARDPINISCFEWDDDRSSNGTGFQANYNARAIIVFGLGITSLGKFQFLPLTNGGTTATTPVTSSEVQSNSEPESTPSISESTTTPLIPSQTEETALSPPSTTDTPTSTS
ncbi:uncharacterized protein DFL_009298 [Arthrobotrys flagrans]|uniref:Uncharacterized protein n=1 Tax=Arthrobotrys flagrans TaxID=97331 RepID=A0A436ZRA6_ARTFL|nr:hypothetical protein DFL_009298 [Arthrobotrys flagrans]